MSKKNKKNGNNNKNGNNSKNGNNKNKNGNNNWMKDKKAKSNVTPNILISEWSVILGEFFHSLTSFGFKT